MPSLPKLPISYSVNHGGKKITFANLSAPVGKENPALLAKYKIMNVPADIKIIDKFFENLKNSKYVLPKAPAHSFSSILKNMFGFGNETEWEWENRQSLISTFQDRVKISDPEEITFRIIKPNGETFKALASYSDIAEKLLAIKTTGKDYIFYGRFNKLVFRNEFVSAFLKNPRYDADAIPALIKLLEMMELDKRIIDIRWMAYMLGTVFWETTYPSEKMVPVVSKKGIPLLDKKSGQPVLRKQRRWAMTMAPVDEIGHGKNRPYYLPVKVTKMKDGTVKVTEQDGDQFYVNLKGKMMPLTTGAKMGSMISSQTGGTYEKEQGTELAYFGRGYVQLTWWANYASAGVAIGQGLELLLHPEMVKDPAIAYAVMAHGMLTGDGYANGHRFANYFYGPTSDYVKARAMVNGKDHAQDIADIALKFEAILILSKEGP
jgi:hypothetical protein